MMSVYRSHSALKKISRKLEGNGQTLIQYFAVCSYFMIFEETFDWPAIFRFPAKVSGLTRNK